MKKTYKTKADLLNVFIHTKVNERSIYRDCICCCNTCKGYFLSIEHEITCDECNDFKAYKKVPSDKRMKISTLVGRAAAKSWRNIRSLLDK